MTWTASGSGTHTSCRCNSYCYSYFLALIQLSLLCIYQFCVSICVLIHCACMCVVTLFYVMDTCVCELHAGMFVGKRSFVPCVFVCWVKTVRPPSWYLVPDVNSRRHHLLANMTVMQVLFYFYFYLEHTVLCMSSPPPTYMCLSRSRPFPPHSPSTPPVFSRLHFTEHKAWQPRTNDESTCTYTSTQTIISVLRNSQVVLESLSCT